MNEATFHDEWAADVQLDDVLVRPAFEAPTALETRFLLGLMRGNHGSLDGLELLDVGSGLGESSVYFALQGARVTALDVSPRMLATAAAVASHHRVSLDLKLASDEGEIPFENESFDAVYIANAIHHVPDRAIFFDEVRRVLRPRGWFYSWDPLAYNPVINVYRRMATEVRTDDEEPLTFDVLSEARRRFPNLRYRCFWITTLALFLKYFLSDRIHPNAERYWKRIYLETNATLWWWKPLRWIDELLTRLPLVQRLAWNIVLWGQKPHA